MDLSCGFEFVLVNELDRFPALPYEVEYESQSGENNESTDYQACIHFGSLTRRYGCYYENRIGMLIFERVHQKTASQLWLEPCCFGRHDFPGIGDIHQLVYGYGIHGKRHPEFPAVD